jgi:hypothetical protein
MNNNGFVGTSTLFAGSSSTTLPWICANYIQGSKSCLWCEATLPTLGTPSGDVPDRLNRGESLKTLSSALHTYFWHGHSLYVLKSIECQILLSTDVFAQYLHFIDVRNLFAFFFPHSSRRVRVNVPILACTQSKQCVMLGRCVHRGCLI